jgi:hypothetical protein
MYGAYWVEMVLPNPLTSHASIAGVMGVEHVRYEGRLGVKRRRWTTGEIIPTHTVTYVGYMHEFGAVWAPYGT